MGRGRLPGFIQVGLAHTEEMLGWKNEAEADGQFTSIIYDILACMLHMCYVI